MENIHQIQTEVEGRGLFDGVYVKLRVVTKLPNSLLCIFSIYTPAKGISDLYLPQYES